MRRAYLLNFRLIPLIRREVEFKRFDTALAGNYSYLNKAYQKRALKVIL